MIKRYKMVFACFLIFIVALGLWIFLVSGLKYKDQLELVMSLVIAVIGAAITIVGILMTYDFSKEQYSRALLVNKESYDDDLAIRLRPHLRILKRGNGESCDVVYFDATKEKIDAGSYTKNAISVTLNIKNIGLASAIGIKFKINDYLGSIYNNLDEAYVFDLSSNEEINLCLRMFWMKNGVYDLTLYHNDIIDRNEYQQKWKIYIKGQCVENIIINSSKSS